MLVAAGNTGAKLKVEWELALIALAQTCPQHAHQEVPKAITVMRYCHRASAACRRVPSWLCA